MLATLMIFFTFSKDECSNGVIYLQDTAKGRISFKKKSKCQCKIKHLDSAQFIKILSYSLICWKEMSAVTRVSWIDTLQHDVEGDG